MTNAMLILAEQIRLMNEGIIGTTGNVFVFNDGNGSKKELPEPEPIHTFQYWKSIGYSVKRGEKAIAKIQIWKYTKKKTENENGEEVDKSKMFMKTACFFALRQVEKIKK